MIYLAVWIRVLTGQNATTAIAIGDRAIGADAKLRSWEAIVTDTILSVTQLAHGTR